MRSRNSSKTRPLSVGGDKEGAVNSVLGFLGLLVLLAFGLHVASVLFLVGMSWAAVSLGKAVILDFGRQVWLVLNNFVMTSIPLFVLMGELLLRTGVTDKMYHSLSLWLARFPGGLLHTNIAACAVMAATSGSSVATAATIGTVSLPTLMASKYNLRLALGTIAAGGTLGILIPPSINMIIYGSIVDASIGRLFIGGVIPGLLLAGSFSVIIAVIALIRPEVSGVPVARTSLWHKISTLPSFLPSLIVIMAVLGSIYLGWATPTEAAALGVVAVLLIAIARRKITLASLNEALASTVKTASMILLIMVGAFYLNYVISILGVPQVLTKWFVGMNISPTMTMWVIMVFYLILGMFIETVAMMVTTIPLIVPLVVAMGYDIIWFGIFLVVLCEASLITPPVGMNLYVVQGIRMEKGPLMDIFIGTIPFLIMMFFLLVALIYWPDLALWLPNQMIGK
jgi:C4-dicarboxylate transporter, DctM subunit